MASVITDQEAAAVKAANDSGKTPAVFIHGLWLLSSSWDRWASTFEAGGYAPVKIDWPDDPPSVEEARRDPEVFAGKSVGQVADHVADVIAKLGGKPVVIGHSFGGLLAQITAGRGLSAATVAIDPASFRGILPVPLSTLRSVTPIVSNPLNRGKAITLTLDQFKYGWVNNHTDEEAKRLHDEYHVAAPALPLFQGLSANLNPATELKVDTKTAERGPLLIISGEKDHTIPWALANAQYKKQKGNPNTTEITEVPGRTHALTIDSGWREVCDLALDFVKRFEP